MNCKPAITKQTPRLKPLTFVTLAAALLAASACTSTAPHSMTTPLDLKISNGRIIDGTGSPWFRGDVGIRGDQIVAIGDLHDVAATNTIDAHDHVIAPGFIDLLGQSEGVVLIDPHLETKVRQGVTTEVSGEGFSPGPVTRKQAAASPGADREWATLDEYFRVLERHGTALNFGLFVGSSNPRSMVIGNVNRQPTMAEMHEMEQIVDQAMRDGALGLSTSLIYLPAMFSKTEEIVNLARVAAKYHGVYFTHMRDEGSEIDRGLDEAFRIGREAEIPVNIWHLKIGGRGNWGRMPHVVERILAARAEGLDVAANVYPYVASGTSLSTLAPDWSLEGGYKSFQERLADPIQLPKILDTFRAQVEKRGAHGIFVSRIDNPALSSFEKKFIEDIAAEMHVSPEDALVRLFRESTGSPSVIYFTMNEEDVQYALKQPFVSVGSDSGSVTAGARAHGVGAHPRAYGTFARVAGHYVRDVHLFTLEEAVRKMTSMAAARVRFDDRGILRPGMKADVIVFDPETIRDVATYQDPHHFSEGVEDVVVNGLPVLRDGRMTDALPGRVLRGRGYRKH